MLPFLSLNTDAMQLSSGYKDYKDGYMRKVCKYMQKESDAFGGCVEIQRN
jgi:hypothetical protein